MDCGHVVIPCLHEKLIFPSRCHMKINFPTEPTPKINYLTQKKIWQPPPPISESNGWSSPYIALQRPQSITDKLSVAHCALRVAPFTTSHYLKLSLKFYIVPVCLNDVINIVNQKVLSCKHVSTSFYCKNMTSFLNYVTATLRTLYAWRGSYCYWKSILIK